MFDKIISIRQEGKYHTTLTFLGVKLKIRNNKNFYIEKLKEIKSFTELQIKRVTPSSELKAFEIHLTEHCNLNCKGCGHFSNIAEEEFLELATFKKDLRRMYELTNGNVKFIELLGGEPLLHPDCAEFCKQARLLFNKNTVIRLVTNGILLPNQPDTFFKTLAEYNILISPTKYPINIDWDSIIKRCKKFGTPIKFYQGTGENLKIMLKHCLDLDGNQNGKENILHCRLGEPDYHYLRGGGYCSLVGSLRILGTLINTLIKTWRLQTEII